ncbi:MAG: cytochrome c oxidase subunit II [Nitrospirae bacterium]|nr:cytochrome c oxidase subunit II [Nitrospirota bacterium]
MFLGPSNIAGKIETSFLIIVASCVILLALVTITMLVFLYRYNRKRTPVATEIRENLPLEVAWTVLPTVLVIAMFYFGWVDFDYIRNPPPNAMPIHVTARQWSWGFSYENGKQSDDLRVPVGTPVKLIMTSEDVLHCLFIPAYRVKEDCVPGMETHLWFTATETGTYEIFCTEYCGLEHSHMRSQLIAMRESDFNSWYAAKEKAVATPESRGKELLQSKGCLGCHTTDGTKKVGPTFKGLYGRKVTVMTNGKERTVTADDEYIEHSIEDPKADIVKGFPPIMPAIPATDEEMKDIIAYLKTLK